MRLTKTLLFFWLAFLFVQFQAVAQTNTADILIQEQERIRAQQERDAARERLKKSIEEEKKDDVQPKDKKPKGRCFPIERIELDGKTLLPNSTEDKILAPYINECLSLSDIDIIIHDVTKWYIDKGYITTRMYLPKQNIKSGTLRLQVVEGTIEGIKMNKDTARDKRRVYTAFPTVPENILNLEDLDRGITNLKYPASVESTMTIEPGTKPGQSFIRVRTTDKKPYAIRLTYDNLGQESTGEDRLRLDTNWDNALALNETISFMALSNIDRWNTDHKTNVYNARLDLPFGNWRSAFSFLYSEYLVTSQGILGVPIETSGETKKFTWDLEREIVKTQRFTLQLKNQFSYYDTNAYIFDALNPASTYDLASIAFGPKGSWYVLNTYWTFDLNYERGIAAFGATKDVNNLANDEPTAQFEKYMLTLSGQKSWDPIDLQITASGQYSPDTLYSAENLVIGDRYSVRGFKEDSVFGESGFYVQSNLGYNFHYPKLKSWFLDPVQNFKVLVGLDAGQVKHLGQTDAISGWSIGLKGYGEKTNWEIILSQAIEAPETLEKETVIYMNFGITLF